MSAILSIRTNASWSVSPAVFDMVLELIAVELEVLVPEIATEARSRINNLPYWSVDTLDNSQFQAFLQATIHAFEHEFQTLEKRQTPLSKHFGALGLYYFSELKAVLRIDPRNNYQEQEVGKILFRDDVTWEALDWVYDLLLEIFAAFISESNEDQLLPQHLMESRSLTNGKICDLRSLSHEQMQLFVKHLDWLHLRYIESGVSAGHAPEYKQALFPSVIKLYDLFHPDKKPNDPPRPLNRSA